jgi:hypothetical protein
MHGGKPSCEYKVMQLGILEAGQFATCYRHFCVFRAERKCGTSCTSQGLQKFTIKVKISDLEETKIIIVNKLDILARTYLCGKMQQLCSSVQQL